MSQEEAMTLADRIIFIEIRRETKFVQQGHAEGKIYGNPVSYFVRTFSAIRR